MRSTHPPRPARATNRGPSQRAGLPPSAGRSGTLSMLGMRAGQSAAVVGLRNLQAIADGGPIQRDVTVGVAAGNINAITVDRANMTSLFGGDQGDHTTAFVVFAAMFHNRLNGQTLAGARVVLHAIRGEILALPGYINIAAAPAWAQAITAAELATVNAARLVANGAGAGVTVAQINAYASALLSFRNVIPLSAIEFGGTGHAEGYHHAQLQALNGQLAGGAALTAARRQTLRDHALGLVDHAAVSQINTNPLHPDEQDTFPGFQTAGAAAITNNQARIANQHVQSIESAYPAIRVALAAAPVHRAALVTHIEGQL